MKVWLGGLAILVLALNTVRGADVSDLLKQMKSKSADERRQAALQLGQATDSAQQVVPALIDGLKDSDFFVRRFSAQSLGRLGGEARSAAPALTAVARDKKERKEVVEAAVVALGSMGPAAVDALADTVKNGNASPALRRRAAQSLARLGKDAHSAVPALTEAMTARVPRRGDNENDIRVDVVTALGEIATSKDEETVKALETLMESRIRDRTLANALRTSVRKIKARK